MAYTTPTTHVAGETLPAADYNVIVNDVIAIRAASVNVQQTVVTTAQAVTLTSANTYYEIPALSVAITPTTNTSKVLITGTLFIASILNQGVAFGLFRDGSVVSAFQNTQATPSARTIGQIAFQTGSSWYGDDAVVANLPFCFLDSPATTSAVTYKIYAKATSTGQIQYLNRSRADSDTGGSIRGSSFMVCKEVAV